MNSTEPGCGGRIALAPLVVLVVLLAIGPAVAGASGGGHLAVAGASSDGDVAGEASTAASDVDGPVPAAAGDGSTAADAGSAADDAPFVREYGEAEPDLPTSVVVHSVVEGEGPVVEAGGELDMAAGDAFPAPGDLDPDADRRVIGSVREATLDADPARALETNPADAEGSVPPADVTGDPSTGSEDHHSAPGVRALVEGMTVPLAPLGGDLAGFALGSLFGGFVVAAFALRRRGGGSTPGPDGPTGSPGSDDPAGSPTLDGPDGSGRPEQPRGTDATTADDAPSAAIATPPDSGDGDPDAGPPPLEVEPGLVPDDCLVERLLARHDGRLKQSAIVDRTGWSKSKVSRLLTRMADDGRVVKVQVGRENVIYLDGAEPRVVSDSSPNG